MDIPDPLAPFVGKAGSCRWSLAEDQARAVVALIEKRMENAAKKGVSRLFTRSYKARDEHEDQGRTCAKTRPQW